MDSNWGRITHLGVYGETVELVNADKVVLENALLVVD